MAGPHRKTMARLPTSQPSTYPGSVVVQLWSVIEREGFARSLISSHEGPSYLPAIVLWLGNACALGLPKESNNGPRNSSQGAQEGQMALAFSGAKTVGIL